MCLTSPALTTNESKLHPGPSKLVPEEDKDKELKEEINNFFTSLDSPDSFEDINKLEAIVNQSAHYITYFAVNDMPKSITYVRKFSRSFEAALKVEGYFTCYTNTSRGVSSLYEALLAQVISKLSKNNLDPRLTLTFISLVESDAYLSPRTEWQYRTRSSIYSAALKVVSPHEKELRKQKVEKHRVFSKLAESWQTAPPKERGILRYAILNWYKYKPSLKVALDDELVQLWKTKSEKSDLHATLYLVALMYCDAPPEEKMKRSLPLLMTHLEDQNIPISFRLSIAASYLASSPKVVGNEKFMRCLVKTGDEYFKGNRNVKTLLFRDLFGALNEAYESYPEHTQRFLPFFQTWHKKAILPPYPGEQKKLFSHLGEASILLSSCLGQTEAMNSLYLANQKNIWFDLPSIYSLLKFKQYKLIEQIIPTIDVITHHFRIPKQYDNSIETLLSDFKKECEHPVVAFRLDYLLLKVPDAEGENAPLESNFQRRERLLTQYDLIKPRLNEKLKYESLSYFTQDRHLSNKWAAPVAEVVTAANLNKLFIDYLDYKSKHTTKIWDHYYAVKIELCMAYAGQQIGAGNFQYLGKVISEFEKLTDEQNSSYGIIELRKKIFQHMTVPLIQILQEGDQDKLQAAYEYSRKLSNLGWNTQWKNSLKQKTTTMIPVGYARLITHALNQPEELQNLGAHLDEPGASKFQELLQNEDNLHLICSIFRKDETWLDDRNEALRLSVMGWLLKNQEVVKSMARRSIGYHDFSLEVSLSLSDLENLLQDEEVGDNVKAILIMLKARYHVQDQPEVAIKNYIQALNILESADANWNALYDSGIHALAKVYAKTNQFEILTEHLNKLRDRPERLTNEKIISNLKRRYQNK